MSCEHRLTIREGQVLSVWWGQPLRPMSIAEAGQHHLGDVIQPDAIQLSGYNFNSLRGAPRKSPAPSYFCHPLGKS